MKKALAHKKRSSARQKRKINKKSSPAYAQLKKHYKPFRIRHVGLIIVAFTLCLVSVFQAGIYYGKSQSVTAPVSNVFSEKSSRVATIRSSYGFSFAFDKDLVEASATESVGSGVASVDEQDFRNNKPIISVTLASADGAVPSRESAAQLSFRLNQDREAFAIARSAAPKTLSDQQVAASLFEVSSDDTFDIDMILQTNHSLNGIKTLKRIYQYTPKFSILNNKTYSVQWAGVIDDRAFSIHLQGLVDDSSIPAALQTVFDTLSFSPTDGDGSVLGTSTSASFLGISKAQAQTLDEKYIVDSVSPAVVKIYHVTCGTLVVAGQGLGGESCTLNAGSGFFISSSGYLATNGHVVTNSAGDVFIAQLANSPDLLNVFLKGAGLSDTQIKNIPSNPALLASLISEVYELPEDDLRIENESHTYIVALGEDPLEITSVKDMYALRNRNDTKSLVKATLVDTDYSSKDIYNVGAGHESGFSSSDVAILKTPLEDTPYIKLSSEIVTQNMDVTIVGFPGDAENSLTDNTKLSTTVTSGSISAIRSSAGGKYKLYQSDADASQGSSGGPVLGNNGEVLGLLTYRFKNDTEVDAAKSYIRAIEDLQALIDKNNIQLSFDGEVQSGWERGLDLYSNNRFSKAILEFESVIDAFPAHRLANMYIANAEKAIAEGRDTRGFPVIMAIGSGATIIAIGAGIILAVRHRGYHQAYKMRETLDANNPSDPTPPTHPSNTESTEQQTLSQTQQAITEESSTQSQPASLVSSQPQPQPTRLVQ